jgi:Leucine-rich repeat (LRR) protein
MLLDIGNNQIVDSFPYWMGILPKLQVLVIRPNQFFGMITNLQENYQTINYFSSLQILDLASNSFSGHLPQGWFNELNVR